MKKATLKDIAQAAQVSVATVSNVLNNRHHKASQATVAHIMKIAAELQYAPDLNARALVTKEARLVSVIFYSQEVPFHYSDPFVATLLEGIERIAQQEQYYIVLHNVASIEAVHDLRRKWAFAGHIVVGCQAEVAEALIESVTEPLVFIDTYFSERGRALIAQSPQVYLVNSRDYSLAYQGLEGLAKSQGLKLAFLTYEVNLAQDGVIQSRYRGANAAYQAAGGQGDLPVYYQTALPQLVEQLATYQGVMVTADILAMDLVKAGTQAYGQWPDETRIMSFDNIPYLQYLATEVNTIDLNQVQKGECAMETLATHLQGDGLRHRQQYIEAVILNKNLSM